MGIPSQCTVHPARTHVTHSNAPTLPLTPVIQKELDEGTEPYFLEDIVRSDAADRHRLHITPADYGHRWRATFRTLTGDAPVCGPGDRDKARQYWQRLREAMRRGGWSRSEWTQLYRIEKVWRARAHGRDARFEVVGTRRGKVTAEESRVLEQVLSIQRVAGAVR